MIEVVEVPETREDFNDGIGVNGLKCKARHFGGWYRTRDG